MKDYVTQGIKEAAQRHSTSLSSTEIAAQYREIKSRPAGDVTEYKAPEEEEKPKLEVNKALNLFMSTSAVALPVGFVVAVVQVAATGALNIVFGWCIGGGFAFFIIANLFTSSGRKTEKKKEGDTHYHYTNNNYYDQRNTK